MLLLKSTIQSRTLESVVSENSTGQVWKLLEGPPFWGSDIKPPRAHRQRQGATLCKRTAGEGMKEMVRCHLS